MAHKITPQQDVYVDGIMSGLSAVAAGKAAGYSDATSRQMAPGRAQAVQRTLDEARQALARATNIRKKDVIMGVLDAIDRARLAGEPNTEINGWKEVAKLMGYYAPEVKKIDLDNGKITLKHGDIKNLDMPGMTMVFTVRDKGQLTNLKPGDKVQFMVVQEGGKMIITDIQPVR